jgi:hypothetical protein
MHFLLQLHQLPASITGLGESYATAAAVTAAAATPGTAGDIPLQLNQRHGYWR